MASLRPASRRAGSPRAVVVAAGFGPRPDGAMRTAAPPLAPASRNPSSRKTFDAACSVSGRRGTGAGSFSAAGTAEGGAEEDARRGGGRGGGRRGAGGQILFAEDAPDGRQMSSWTGPRRRFASRYSAHHPAACRRFACRSSEALIRSSSSDPISGQRPGWASRNRPDPPTGP